MALALALALAVMSSMVSMSPSLAPRARAADSTAMTGRDNGVHHAVHASETALQTDGGGMGGSESGSAEMGAARTTTTSTTATSTTTTTATTATTRSAVLAARPNITRHGTCSTGRRDCRSAASSPFSRCFDRDGERGCQQKNSLADGQARGTWVLWRPRRSMSRAGLAPDETVILLPPPPHLAGVSIGMERERESVSKMTVSSTARPAADLRRLD